MLHQQDLGPIHQPLLQANATPFASQVALPETQSRTRNQSRRSGHGQTQTSAPTSQRAVQMQIPSNIGNIPPSLPNAMSGAAPFAPQLNQRPQQMHTFGTSNLQQPRTNAMSNAAPFAPSQGMAIPPLIDLTGENQPSMSQMRNRESSAIERTSTTSRLTNMTRPSGTQPSASTSQQGQSQSYPWQIMSESAGMVGPVPDAPVITSQPTTINNQLATADLENRPPQSRRNKRRAKRRQEAIALYNQQRANQLGNNNLTLLLKYFVNFILDLSSLKMYSYL